MIRTDELEWPRPRRMQIGKLPVDAVTLSGAVDAIEALVRRGRGGQVFTPNVDHVVQAEENAALREAYAGVDLSLADGAPILWAARFLGTPLPEKVSGSDLVLPLMQRAAVRGFRIYLLGGMPGVAARAAERLQQELCAEIVGVDDAMVPDPSDVEACKAIYDRIARASPDLVLVAFGAPKQEIFIQHARRFVPRPVMIGVGASLDFIAGEVKRAPRWISRAGFEWLYRLSKEPRRLWRRYLLRDPAFFKIVWRMRKETTLMLPAGSTATAG